GDGCRALHGDIRRPVAADARAQAAGCAQRHRRPVAGSDRKDTDAAPGAGLRSPSARRRPSSDLRGGQRTRLGYGAQRHSKRLAGPPEGFMTQGYFVTGTDTGVGKTRISLALMRALQAQGHTVLGMKPVASGCRSTADGLRNDDAVQLRAQASFDVPYDQVNPYAFEPPIAPHLAALAVGTVIRIDVIRDMLDRLGASADRVVVEGVGGWLVPIDASATMADVAVAVDLPVVLVVAVRLGCLNHALLTAA